MSEFTKQLFKVMAAKQQEPKELEVNINKLSSGLSIINAIQTDIPQPGQVIASEYDRNFRIIKCNMNSCVLEDIETGLQYLVRCASIIVNHSEFGMHWYLQKRRSGLIPLGLSDSSPEHGLPKAEDFVKGLKEVQTVKASKDKPADIELSVKVLVDRAGHNLAQKMFKSYISTEDFSLFPKFIVALDKLLLEYGATSSISTEEDEDQPEVEEDEDLLSGESDEEDEDLKDKVKEESSVKEADSSVSGFFKTLSKAIESLTFKQDGKHEIRSESDDADSSELDTKDAESLEPDSKETVEDPTETEESSNEKDTWEEELKEALVLINKKLESQGRVVDDRLLKKKKEIENLLKH